MARYILVATSGATHGQDAELNKWYDEIHAPEVCSIPGIKSCQRFEQSAGSPMPPIAPYLAIYEVETDDPEAVTAELMRRAAAKELTPGEAMDPTNARLWLFKAL